MLLFTFTLKRTFLPFFEHLYSRFMNNRTIVIILPIICFPDFFPPSCLLKRIGIDPGQMLFPRVKSAEMTLKCVREILGRGNIFYIHIYIYPSHYDDSEILRN